MKRLPNVNNVLEHVDAVLRDATPIVKTASVADKFTVNMAKDLCKVAQALRENNSAVTLQDVVTFHQRLMRNA
jgi:hypothetical protein